MITCQVESLTDRLEELKPLFVPHWEELALNKDKVPLDPQYDIYLARDALGEVLFVTVRENGKLLGYFIGFIAPGLHYKTCLTLTMDIFWLHPSLRDAEDSLDFIEKEMICMDLFELVKKEAMRRGVKRAYYGSKSHKDASVLFEKLGMGEVERYHSAWWGD